MRFVLLAWLISRAIVAVALIIATPHPLASTGNWDGAWYGSIAQHGYGYAHLGAQSDAAFLPLYPLLASVLLHAGVPWPLAGVLINNAAFLGALFVLYAIARRQWDASTARWCVAVACACPLSLFASVAYREGVYLLLSALALWWTLRMKHLPAAFAAAAATATSVLGLALAGAMVLSAVKRRNARDISISMFAFAGIGIVALFYYLRFGDPLAFAHGEHAWRTAGVDLPAWLRVLASLRTVDGFRQNVMVIVLVPFATIAMIVQRKSLGLLLSAYGLLTIAIILIAGEPISADRYAYATIPVLIALGRALQRVPVAGGAAVLASVALLAYDTVQFARFHWVA